MACKIPEGSLTLSRDMCTHENMAPVPTHPFLALCRVLQSLYAAAPCFCPCHSCTPGSDHGQGFGNRWCTAFIATRVSSSKPGHSAACKISSSCSTLVAPTTELATRGCDATNLQAHVTPLRHKLLLQHAVATSRGPLCSRGRFLRPPSQPAKRSRRWNLMHSCPALLLCIAVVSECLPASM